jgi:hypothetical protein
VALADLVPESVLLAPARAAGGATPLALPDRPTEIVAVLDRSLGALAARATSTADGALVRVAARLRADLALLAADVDEMQCGG